MAASLGGLHTLVKSVAVEGNTVSTNRAEENATEYRNSSKSSKQRALSKKRWKDQHKASINASERERKGRLSANIAKLKEILPLPKTVMTKEAVIEEAISYIQDLKQKNEEMILKDAEECLKEKLELLRKEVLELKEQRKVYQSLLASHAIPNNISTNQPRSKVPIARIKPKSTNPKTKPTTANSNITIPTPSTASIPTSQPACSTKWSILNKTSAPITVLLSGSNAESNALCTTTSRSNPGPPTQSTSTASNSHASNQGDFGPGMVKQMISIMMLLCAIKTLCTDNPPSTKEMATSVTSVNSVTTTPPTVVSCESLAAEVTQTVTNLVVTTAISKTTVHESVKSVVASNYQNSTNSPFGTAKTTITVQESEVMDRTASGGQVNTDNIETMSKKPATVNTEPELNAPLSPVITRPSSLQIGKHAEPSLTQISSSPQADCNLLAWLRSSEEASMDVATSSGASLPPTNASYSAMAQNPVPPMNRELLSGQPLNHKRPNVNFNIASLMKPSDVTNESHVTVSASEKTKDPRESEAIEFNAATLHQSFDNDILDCLQGLTTPEPPTRHGVGVSGAERVDQSASSDARKRDQSISSTLNELLYPDGAHCQQLDVSSPFPGATNAKAATPRVVNTAEGHVGKVMYGNPTHHHPCATQNAHPAATSLWQPAIAELTPNKQHAGAGFADCFSPISSQYIGQGTPQFHQRLLQTTHGPRSGQGLVSSGTWMPTGSKTNAVSAAGNGPSQYSQHLGSLVHAPRADQSKPASAKKRKASKGPSSSKKKKAQSNKNNLTPHYPANTASSSEFQQPVAPRGPLLHHQASAAPLRFYPGNEGGRRMYPGVQNLNPVVGHHGPVAYNPDLCSQANIFHQQGVGYPAGSHAPYFPYNPRIQQNQHINYAVPGFANANNSNNNAAGGGQGDESLAKASKASQHHIKQILA